MNRVCLEITNCCDCPYHYTEPLHNTYHTEDVTVLYCSKTEHRQSYNQKHKMVVADSEDIRLWSQIPDWCPLKAKN